MEHFWQWQMQASINNFLIEVGCFLVTKRLRLPTPTGIVTKLHQVGDLDRLEGGIAINRACHSSSFRRQRWRWVLLTASTYTKTATAIGPYMHTRAVCCSVYADDRHLGRIIVGTAEAFRVLDGMVVQMSAKWCADFVKQDPGRARQNS